MVKMLVVLLLGCIATLGKYFTHVCLCHQAVGTSLGAAMYCGWKGNRGHGVAVAMHH